MRPAGLGAGGPHYLRRFRRAVAGPALAAPPHAAAPRLALGSEAFPDAREWAGRPDRLAVLRKLLRGRAGAALAAAAALDLGPVDLSGPTGEANTLMLVPRGRVLCLGPDAESLLAQAVQALAAGNAVLAVAPDAMAALKPLLGKDLPLKALEGTVEPAELEDFAADAVAFHGPTGMAKTIRQALARRAGPIAPLISELICPAAYAVERAVCVDTTAAGGNASLLAGL